MTGVGVGHGDDREVLDVSVRPIAHRSVSAYPRSVVSSYASPSSLFT